MDCDLTPGRRSNSYSGVIIPARLNLLREKINAKNAKEKAKGAEEETWSVIVDRGRIELPTHGFSGSADTEIFLKTINSDHFFRQNLTEVLADCCGSASCFVGYSSNPPSIPSPDTGYVSGFSHTWGIENEFDEIMEFLCLLN